MARHLNNVLYFFIGLLGFKSTAAMAATEIFLCDSSGELQGETDSELRKGCVDVLAWSWGTSLFPGGAPSIQDVSLTKFVDKASPLLLESSTSGKTFPKVELFVDQACCEPELLKITMEKVYISSFQTGGSMGEDWPTESISLNFTKIQYCYTYFDDTGKPGVPDCYGWDVQFAEPY
jgi:type VI secretion system secreted protein Hcp